jgi:hypothetical protein
MISNMGSQLEEGPQDEGKPGDRRSWQLSLGLPVFTTLWLLVGDAIWISDST